MQLKFALVVVMMVLWGFMAVWFCSKAIHEASPFSLVSIPILRGVMLFCA